MHLELVLFIVFLLLQIGHNEGVQIAVLQKKQKMSHIFYFLNQCLLFGKLIPDFFLVPKVRTLGAI